MEWLEAITELASLRIDSAGQGVWPAWTFRGIEVFS